ncbi:MAG: hypothetical protein LIP04_01665 [Tannerellaceae bacterium]|nr:hypothetical protein [Tannerellaceae bacterium]
MSWIPGTAAHSWQAVAASGSSLGIQGAYVAAEVIAATTADLLLNPGLIQTAQQEMQKARGETFIYKPLLGTREPDLNYHNK